MDRAGRRDRVLERIVAILLSLAVLAGHAAGRSFPVRWLLLLVLRRAGTVAAFLLEQRTGMEWPFSEDCGENGSGPADALLLAARLRALAACLAALLPDAAHVPGRAAALRDRAGGLAGPQAVLLFLIAPGRRAAIRCDTS